MQPLIFLSLLSIPSLTMVSIDHGSMSAGLALFIFGFLAYTALTLRPNHLKSSNRNYNQPSMLLQPILFVGLLSIILIHTFLLIITNHDVNILRFILSISLLAFMLAAAFGYASRIINTSDDSVKRIVNYGLWFLVLNALLPLFNIELYWHNSLIKPVGVFAEPSHFGLVLAPILAFICATNYRHYPKIIAFFFLWSIYIESLVAIIVIIFALAIVVSFKNILSISTAIVFAFGFIVAFGDVEYFTSRMVISSYTDNLSVLVWLNGWMTAFEMVWQTDGWGSGFQQFGYLNTDLEISERVIQLAGIILSRFDGGTVGAKILGEFGLFGLLAIIAFVILATRAFFQLRSAYLNNENAANVLFSSILYTFTIEVFFRGTGYFSPTGFLLLCALVAVTCKGTLTTSVIRTSKPSNLQPQ